MGKFDRSSSMKKASRRKSSGRSSSKGGSKKGSSRGSSRAGSSRGSTRAKGPSRFGSKSGGRYDKRESKHGSKNRRDFQMTKVTCDGCGIDTEVPFKPTSNKPVYCKACFDDEDKKKPEKRVQKESKKSVPKVTEHNLDLINEKLNKIMKALNIE